jgi:hypothetical protein
VPEGGLPPGISLTSDGRLAGKSSSAGSFSLTVQVTDGSGRAARKAISINVADTPLIKVVKYKAKNGKLKIKGERFDSSALLIDRVRANAAVSGGSIVAKSLRLAPGIHEIRVVDPLGRLSDPFFLEVD